MVTTILLARHGETDWNREGRMQGQSDQPLNALGRAQAGALAEALVGVELAAVYSSDLRRAYETARIVADARGMDVVVTAALREVDFGEWEGMRRDEIEHRFPVGHSRWRRYEGHGWEHGESYEEMGARVVAAVLGIAAGHPGEQVLLVAHGGPIRAVHAHASGLSAPEARRETPIVENCHVARLEIEDGALRWLD